MRARGWWIVGLIALGLSLLAGCGSGDDVSEDAVSDTTAASTTTTTPTTTTIDSSVDIDTVIDLFIRAATTLSNVSGTTNSDLLAQMDLANSDLEQAVEILRTEDFSDVPADLIASAVSATESGAAALDAVVGCLSDAGPLVTANSCSSTTSIGTERMREAGESIGHLVAYGTRSPAEVQELLPT